MITLSMQKDIDSGGGAGYPPKNMTMQIKDGNCNVEMGMFQTLYHLFESEHVILSPQIRILRFDIFSTSKKIEKTASQIKKFIQPCQIMIHLFISMMVSKYLFVL